MYVSIRSDSFDEEIFIQNRNFYTRIASLLEQHPQFTAY